MSAPSQLSRRSPTCAFVPRQGSTVGPRRRDARTTSTKTESPHAAAPHCGYHPRPRPRTQARATPGGAEPPGTTAAPGRGASGTSSGSAARGEPLTIIPRYLIPGRRVFGCSSGGLKGRADVPVLASRYLAGEIDVDALVSHRISLEEVNRGFELIEAHDGIRSVIEF